jgi:hypothetical protein
VTCRERIAERYQLAPRKNKPWQHEGRCPKCGHGGFSITAGDQGPNAPRHIWWCNCHRCGCDPADIRAAMLADGIDPDCLGSYKKRGARQAVPANPADMLKAALLRVLSDTKIRALADLKIKVLEIVDEKPAPEDCDGFVAFAARAGVSRSKRYEAAERWGRSATAVGTPSEETLSSGHRSGPMSAVPKRDAQEALPSRFGTTDSPEAGQRTQDDISNRRPAA